MSANKNKDNKDDTYFFIQEKIVPKTKNTKRKMIRYICSVTALAILFGAVSSLVFTTTNRWLGDLGQKEAKEPISLDEEDGKENLKEPVMTEEPGTEEGSKGSDKQKNELTDTDISGAYDIRSYQKMYSVMRSLSEQCKYSMVTVKAIKDITSWFDKEDSKESYGLIISIDRDYIYILCNYSSVQGVTKLEVEFFNEEATRAEYMDRNKETGIALLKVKKSSVTQRTNDRIQKAELGNSYQIGRGIPVLGLGAPDGTMNSMMIGYVTTPCIDKYIVDGKLGLYHTNLIENANGEGFFVDMDGKVVGIITHQYKKQSDQNIMSFLGITKLKPLIECLLNEKKMAYIGIKVSELSSNDVKKLNVSYGIYITEVLVRSPAFKQGLRAGDVITEVDGVSVSSVSALMDKLAERKSGEDMMFTIMRQAKVEYPKNSFTQKHITITLG